MKLLRATILTMRVGQDLVSIKTDLPESVYPYVGCLEVSFRCARNTAEDYLKKHFPGLPFERI